MSPLQIRWLVGVGAVVIAVAVATVLIVVLPSGHSDPGNRTAAGSASTASTTSRPVLSTGPATTVAPTQPTTQPPPPAPDVADGSGPPQFVTPTNNIGCYVTNESARCDINQRDWTPPPKPASCDLDWGQGLNISASGVHFTCAGDTVLGAADVLAYGSSARRGDFVCTSAPDGMTCLDIQTGHGFRVSRQRYEVF